MNLYDNELYIKDVKSTAEIGLPWEKLKNKSILLSGATGLIGSFLIDTVLMKNASDINCTVYALCRNVQKAKERFSLYEDNPNLVFVFQDVSEKIVLKDIKKDIKEVDYVIHLASNTHPLAYSTDPIGTITTNVLGLKNMLDFAVTHNAKRFMFASSNEIYGENRGDTEFFDENYCGYINSNTLRAGYPESKRCGEALCQAYRIQKNLDVVIPRLTRSFGPTMLESDTKAMSQFLMKGVKGEDVVLKSAGTQFYSYTYVADAVSGLLYALLCGKNGEAYNIADEKCDITLKDLAQLIASINKKNVVFETPDSVELAGYSTATKARLDGHKLQELGWKAQYSIEDGVRHTIKILKDL